MRAITSRPCELCKRPASLYCRSDAAFLCHPCDAAVHQANFLVARHLRHPLCSNCTSFCPHSYRGIGTGHPEQRALLCTSCSAVTISNDMDHLSYTSSPTCISTAESSAVDKTGAASSSGSEPEVSGRKPNRRRAVVQTQREGVVASWCDRLGLVPSRVRLLALSLAESGSRGLPLRVSLAASFWLALRFCGSASATATWETLLGRVEAVSGVPRKLIVAASAKVAQRATRPARANPDGLILDLEEGWAECSA